MIFPLLQRLREETSALHQRLEKNLDLLRPELTLQDYRAGLEAFYGFYSTWERAVQNLGNGLSPEFIARRQKLPWLIHDLEGLGCDETRRAALPRWPVNPRLLQGSALWGALYVLEGSTLGGQWIAKHVEKTLGNAASLNCAYYQSYGEAVGPMWKSFLELLHTQSSPESVTTITLGACLMFKELDEWLSLAKTNA